ncbi:MAG TPA: hypothetical protein VF508_03625, partial [Pyrinomonadaceae bacterium]
MEVPLQNSQLDEEVTLVVSGEEATLVAPRFDDEETLVARPVVPFGEAGVAEAPAPAVVPAAGAAWRSAYARLPFKPRRSWLLALMLVSVLIGGVLGGAGLYLYQRQTEDGGAPPQAEAQPEQQQQQAVAPAPAEAPQPEPQPQPDAAATAPAAEADTAEPEAAPAREPENVPAAGRRDADETEGGALKRGKKGARDEE